MDPASCTRAETETQLAERKRPGAWPWCEPNTSADPQPPAPTTQHLLPILPCSPVRRHVLLWAHCSLHERVVAYNTMIHWRWEVLEYHTKAIRMKCRSYGIHHASSSAPSTREQHCSAAITMSASKQSRYGTTPGYPRALPAVLLLVHPCIGSERYTGQRSTWLATLVQCVFGRCARPGCPLPVQQYYYVRSQTGRATYAARPPSTHVSHSTTAP